jgi:hypothetical protein
MYMLKRMIAHLKHVLVSKKTHLAIKTKKKQLIYKLKLFKMNYLKPFLFYF